MARTAQRRRKQTRLLTGSKHWLRLKRCTLASSKNTRRLQRRIIYKGGLINKRRIKWQVEHTVPEEQAKLKRIIDEGVKRTS